MTGPAGLMPMPGGDLPSGGLAAITIVYSDPNLVVTPSANDIYTGTYTLIKIQHCITGFASGTPKCADDT
jgi:hypothetical protein